MGKRLIATALLIAALICLPSQAKQLNIENSVAKAQQVQAEAPRKEPTLHTEQEKALTEPEAITQKATAVNVQTADKPSEPEPQVTSTCADEVKKYDWPQSVALQIVGAESSHDPHTRNDNPDTGDYSIGCFQINLLGQANLNAKYRDAVRAGYTGPATVASLEPWLKVASNNVAVAHIIWSSQGWVPWGATTCAVKVKCY